MNAFVICALISFVYVFFKVFQQLNVVHAQYAWVMPVSLAMGVCEVAIILYIVRADTFWLGISNGVGAGLGAMLAMRWHPPYIRRNGA